ncbi:MAG: hypothetical protein HW419_2603 [Deltaproteobacteria bacterium]|nr:hypothetical protein [Deltaproteobacteria bacterium]
MNYDTVLMLLAVVAISLGSIMALLAIGKRKKARVAVQRHRPEP